MSEPRHVAACHGLMSFEDELMLVVLQQFAKELGHMTMFEGNKTDLKVVRQGLMGEDVHKQKSLRLHPRRNVV